MINGNQILKLISDREFHKISAMPELRKIILNAPPAPVIRIMTAAVNNDLPTQPVVESISRSNFLGKRKARSTPGNKAITGSPINQKRIFANPVPSGWVGKSETDFNTINRRGMIIGIKAFNADGASFIVSIMSRAEIAMLKREN